MPVRLLLDEHLSPVIAGMLRARGVDVASMQEWQGGRRLGANDQELLIEAEKESRTVVSYDVSTLAQAAQELTRSNREHAGVLLISSKTIPPEAYARLCDILQSFALGHETNYLRDLILFAHS
ncbi:MAG: DUF5615 family PIN-like protein [Actinomycetota bacterium]